MTTLSVLIATKDRAADLRECLGSVLSQDPPPSEVIIVDQSARPQGDGLGALFTGSSVRLRYDYAPELPGLTHARNRALAQARGDVLLFLDDDVVLASGYVRAILEVFVRDPEERIGGASGLITNLPRTISAAQRVRSKVFYRGPFAVERDALAFHFRPGAQSRRALRLNGSNMAFRRRVMDAIRFDESYSGYSFGEDRDFSVQVGRHFELRWVPQAKLVHKETPRTRLDRERFCELRILSWLRFYQLWPSTSRTLLSYLWLNVGFAVLLLKIWDPATVKGTFRGLRRLVRILRGQAKLTSALGEGWQPRAT
jgi:GT2 family glycosyltransferase